MKHLIIIAFVLLMVIALLEAQHQGLHPNFKSLFFLLPLAVAYYYAGISRAKLPLPNKIKKVW